MARPCRSRGWSRRRAPRPRADPAPRAPQRARNARRAPRPPRQSPRSPGPGRPRPGPGSRPRRPPSSAPATACGRTARPRHGAAVERAQPGRPAVERAPLGGQGRLGLVGKVRVEPVVAEAGRQRRVPFRLVVEIPPGQPCHAVRARHRGRRHTGLHRAGPQLRIRPLARRRVPVRPPLLRAAGFLLLKRSFLFRTSRGSTTRSASACRVAAVRARAAVRVSRVSRRRSSAWGSR